MTRVRLCFVCLGNICRSPTAAGLMRHHVRLAGLEEAVEIESAGTGSWHVGGPPDRRALAEACRRGVELDHRARQFVATDFARFDLVLAMDHANVADLLALAPDADAAAKVRLLRSFDPAADGDLAVPDPYYEGGFAHVFDLLDAACRGLLETLAPGFGRS
ncbi:MAG: low molecular weight phosphotyrosine protein phosphatase [Acidimicrobiia bacterium]|nr:low molecular weight phosphotyrosine protein phosphatase [Acidimicrobiia bacterium]